MNTITTLCILVTVAWCQASHLTQDSPLYPARCASDPCIGINFTDASYICGDRRLGPVSTPSDFPLSTELQTYARFGNLCPYEFLSKWTAADGNYSQPPENGFVLSTTPAGKPILGNTTLPVGQKLDRFGSEFGTFMSPLGAPYIERSLPPQNLDTSDGRYPYNYHVYQITKAIPVQIGPIAPWYEQPGMGTQFVMPSRVIDLVNNGYLRRLSPAEYDDRSDFVDDYTPGPLNITS
ncbi:hypothetical protein ASPZODRAFT_20787 [Penicilliopsis zonata CBS 506.65]|uniref:TNT domain-containing protein n=1 Tax=Penicilliopsis zonata CBS 506.65 TaxID=1073090 RepID=A0A1L9S4K1_9EURO|nr:hypothetical protein ASPZODRAFT_20787 [Penicilliopsis zonata CBS 506.65]OJJ42100.1 hypothetical protein ASPZODRAFT_20787 [Penicilliopsis zonata CBS 506.65]